MYSEKYFKYKQKYLELKKMVGGNDNIDIEDVYNTLRIENKKKKVVLMIDYNNGEINVTDTTRDPYQSYTIWTTKPSRPDGNSWGHDWLLRTNWEDKPIYIELIKKAKTELENSTTTPMKEQCISKLNLYITELETK